MGWIIAICIALFGLVIWANIEEGKACQAKGGHIISKTEPGFGFSSSGSMVTTLNTISFCLSADGRILE